MTKRLARRARPPKQQSYFQNFSALCQPPAERRGRLLFVNKKKQKNFFQLGRAGFAATGPVEPKFFAPLFFKKAATFLLPLKPIML
jgi:hypothetical protein